MFVPKIKLVREVDTLFDENRLIQDMAERARNLLKTGTIEDSGLGYGFNVRMGKPKTVRELLYPTTSWNKPDSETTQKLKDIINNVNT